ncbi:MAG: hypothetical protein NTZ67_01040 [Gammaproteobacteria bacterium]|nr:hypothetical protein [Gammaproteobacteria bacterium]
MIKKFLLLISVCLISTCIVASPLWHCSATTTTGTLGLVWNEFGNTEHDARNAIEKECTEHNEHKSCAVVCFPPKHYWRCVSHDTVPTTDKSSLNKPKQGAWYWTSSEGILIAINGARDACRHNSQYGGCYVNPNSCASTEPMENKAKASIPTPTSTPITGAK